MMELQKLQPSWHASTFQNWQEIFKNEELDMDDVVRLNNEDLKDIGVIKLKHRKLILQETEKLGKGTSRPAADMNIKRMRITTSRQAQSKVVRISGQGTYVWRKAMVDQSHTL